MSLNAWRFRRGSSRRVRDQAGRRANPLVFCSLLARATNPSRFGTHKQGSAHRHCVLTRGHCRIEANEVTVGARQLGARRDVPPYQSMAHQRVGRQEHPRVGLEGRSLLPDTARRTRSLHHVRHFATPPVLTPIRCLDYNSKDSTLATAGIDDVIRIFPCR